MGLGFRVRRRHGSHRQVVNRNGMNRNVMNRNVVKTEQHVQIIKGEIFSENQPIRIC